MSRTVQIRLIADTKEEAEAAITELQQAVGTARIAFPKPREGRRDQWLSYGTYQIEDAQPPVAATGPTIRLPAIGPTTKLSRRKTP